jgi:hypothetical protein
MTTSERIYRLLVKCYAADYRREYEGPMVQHFCDQLRAVDSGGKLFRLWLRTIADLVGTAPAGWVRFHGLSRFNEESRRAIFFAGFEARSFSKKEIGLEHLLLGLVRSDRKLRSMLPAEVVVQRVEAMEGARQRMPVVTTSGISLSGECKRAIADATRISGTERVSTRNLIRAVLEQKESRAAGILRDCGIDGSRP